MKTVGKQLQDARLAKGWSPEMAARETKIRLDRVRELEEDDYSNFSSPTYARGFVRTYARALGLDEYRILRQLDNKLPEDDNATFANDTGVPYMPEPSQVSKPFQVGRGVYIAGGVGMALLLLIGFILVQSYRAGYFAEATPAPAALPVTATNALPAVPDSETARALPADSNAAPVPVPVDLPPASVATTPPAASTETNAPPRALPVDLNAVASATNTAPVAPAVAPAPAPTPAPQAPVAVEPAPPAATNAPVADGSATVSTSTSTPPRALPVDLNALSASETATNAPAAPTETAVAPAPEPPPVHALSARESNASPSDVHAAADRATQELIAATTPPPVVAQPAPSPVVVPSQQVPADLPPAVATVATTTVQPAAADGAPSSLTPVPTYRPEDHASTAAGDSAATGTPTPVASQAAPASEPFHGKRLVLTASHDSFVRVIALDGSGPGQVRYSSTLHSGQSISFNDRKYTINVGDPSAVDIALDGINYGPHSDTSAPDTFTVESHVP